MPLQRFPVHTPLMTDSRKSVVHMLSKPVAANEVILQLHYYESWTSGDPCYRGNTYHFCIQMEFYGKDLGWYTLI